MAYRSRAHRKKERKRTAREGWEDGTPTDIPHTARPFLKKERKKTDNPREGWEDGKGVLKCAELILPHRHVLTNLYLTLHGGR